MIAVKAFEFASRILAVLSLLLLVLVGGHSAGFLFQLLTVPGFVEFWAFTCLLLLAGSLLLVAGHWVYQRVLTSSGVAAIGLAILVLAIETGGLLTLISALPFALLALLTLIFTFRRNLTRHPPA